MPKRTPLASGGISFSPGADVVGWPTWIFDQALAHDIRDTDADLIIGANQALALARQATLAGREMLNPLTGEAMTPPPPASSGPAHDACEILQKLAHAGKLLVLDQHRDIVDGDRGPELDFYVGDALPDAVVSAAAWHSPAKGHLNVTTGQVFVTCGDGLYEDDASLVALPVGGYEVLAYHRNADAMAASGTDKHYQGPDQAILLRPLSPGEQPTVDMPVLVCP